jgi:hypothetical protein
MGGSGWPSPATNMGCDRRCQPAYCHIGPGCWEGVASIGPGNPSFHRVAGPVLSSATPCSALPPVLEHARGLTRNDRPIVSGGA